MPLLEMAGVCKSYEGVQALTGVDLRVDAGEVHALVGENGAGKSTLIKILAGVVPADAGTIRWDGAPVTLASRREALERGIGVIFQHPEIIDHLTVAENVTLGREHHETRWDRREERRRTAGLLDRLGAAIDPDRLAGGLRAAERQLVEIARALATDVRLLVMDEPTASLGQVEVEHLARVVGDLRDAGIAVVYISHRLDEVLTLTDRITVLRDGRVVGERRTADTDTDDLVSLMVGRQRLVSVPPPDNATDRVVVRAEAISTAAGLDGVSFTLRAGEVLGVYGLLGSGRTELARAVFGDDEILAGTLEVAAAPVRLRHPGDAVGLGVGLVPEDRANQGLMTARPVGENLTVAQAHRLARRGWRRPRAERTRAEAVARDLGIKAPSLDAPVSALSGGNQQKVVVGKWLIDDIDVLVLDEPTAGVDVGAKAEIYRIIDRLTARGVGVLLISSELPEVLGLADRILVLRGGRVVGRLERDGFDETRILRLALGEAA